MDLDDLQRTMRISTESSATDMEDDSGKKEEGRLKLLELEKKLSGPNQREEFSRYDSQLIALQKKIAAELEADNGSEQAERLEKLREAVISARKILKFAVMN